MATMSTGGRQTQPALSTPFATPMADAPVLKRRRTTAACNSCRAKKSKCDGRRPICGRCSGYGFYCSWGKQAQSENTPGAQLTPSANALERSQQLLAVYQQLVQSLDPQLPRDTRAEVRNCLATVQARVGSLGTSEVDASPSSSAHSSIVQPIHSRRYLGEISDVHFCNIVKLTAESDADARDIADCVDNYDPEEVALPRNVPQPLMNMPGRAQVEEDLHTYFSTIHFAYPFVSKPSFLAKLETLQTEGVTSGLTPSWLSLLYALLAIGAYYNSFLERHTQEEHSHQRLFEQSLIWSENDMLERSLTQSSALLAHCFYLLATSQIERCWVSLGLAIRLGQSIGLHVNVEEPTEADAGTPQDSYSESRARVWYCLYVLDRLLALQLGRPPAISDQDCHVPIPHPMAELEMEGQANVSGTQTGNETRRISDYFASVIKFSSIVGRVLRETYHPRRQIEASLSSTESCDKQLLEWKNRLPRHLRFDIGHVFEKSVTFKRQRNMLAIKFHHIRTLIHRPYLCYPNLKGHKTQALNPEQYAQIRQYGETCVQEAQAIAHLMYNVSDTSDIVLNYPWWQMISCLVCAGSVLVLAGTFTKYEPRGALSGPLGLSEDIETLVNVLHALSGNSNGAKLACSMMRSIRERSARISVNGLVDSSGVTMPEIAPVTAGTSENDTSQDSQRAYGYCNELGEPSSGLAVGQMGEIGLGTNVDDPNLWPMVIPDWMNWSTEFLETFQGSEDSTQGFVRM